MKLVAASCLLIVVVNRTPGSPASLLTLSVVINCQYLHFDKYVGWSCLPVCFFVWLFHQISRTSQPIITALGHKQELVIGCCSLTQIEHCNDSNKTFWVGFMTMQVLNKGRSWPVIQCKYFFTKWVIIQNMSSTVKGVRKHWNRIWFPNYSKL